MRQFEIQLGHLCNNRCVFCVSGALTHKREAPLLDPGELCARIGEARREGYARLTLLGGEPTSQPYFLEVVRHAVALGFEEIVVFTNGGALGRGRLLTPLLATGGRFEFRFSFQGATRDAHERTTRRPGSFDQILAALAAVRARGQRATANMCVVRQNFASLPAFPALLAPHGVSQLHVDMFNPYETGTLGDEALRAMQPRYRELVAPLEEMIAGFERVEGLAAEVTIGNLPYCLAPHLARRIHHGGVPTTTVTANDLGAASLQREKVKYLVKAGHRSKPASCRTCVFDGRCAGAYHLYRQWFGDEELVPVSPARLAERGPSRPLFALLEGARIRAAVTADALPIGFARVTIEQRDLDALELHLEGDGRRLRLRFHDGQSGAREEQVRGAGLALEVVEAAGPAGALASALDELWTRLGAATLAPPGADLLGVGTKRIVAALARLRAAAPFAGARWTTTTLSDDGARATLELADGAENRATVWLDDRGGRATFGYRIHAPHAPHAPDLALEAGLRAVLDLLRRGGSRARGAADASG